jgi:hypothetical protein
MQHAEHQMHSNSLAAYSQECEKLDERKKAILDVVFGIGEALTDREICMLLGFSDMNSVRPRITELVQAGRLIELKKIKDATTGKSVRIVSLNNTAVPIA